MIREIADELNLSFGTCRAILTQDLGMRRVSAKLVPRLLTQDQTKHCATACRKWHHLLAKHYHRGWIMDLWLRPWDKTNVVDAEGLVHHEFLPQRQTMNQTVCITILQHLQDAVHRKRPHKWSSDSWLLHHDNMACHAALSVREFLAKHSIPVVPHLLYSPDLAPCNFFLFPRLKSTLEGETISRCHRDTTKYNTAVACHSQTSLPDMHWKVEESLESLHTICRVVLWRR
jgi:histone-lysine N-methyltransferase SETMAR